MATKDPKYIRLAHRLIRGNVTDLRSGFSIAGLDVQPFPEDQKQAAFVRSQTRLGKIEEATEDEFKAVDEVDYDFMAAQNIEIEPMKVKATFQEAAIGKAARAARERATTSRGIGPIGTAAAYAADQRRREAIAEQGDGGDPEDVREVTVENRSGFGTDTARRTASTGVRTAKAARAQNEPLDLRGDAEGVEDEADDSDEKPKRTKS
jgi:hypothetical protein